jgi:hypothetical protein
MVEAADPLLRSGILAPLAKDAALSEYITNAVWLAEHQSENPQRIAFTELLEQCYAQALSWEVNGLAA